MSPVSDFSVSFLSPSTCDSSQETNNSFIVPKMDIKKRPTTDDSQHLDIGNVSGRNAARKVGSKHVSKCIWPKKMRISMDDEAERKENLSAPVKHFILCRSIISLISMFISILLLVLFFSHEFLFV